MKVTFGADRTVFAQRLGKHDVLAAGAFGPKTCWKALLAPFFAGYRIGRWRCDFFFFENRHVYVGFLIRKCLYGGSLRD